MGMAGKSKGEYLWQLSRAGYLWRGELGAEQSVFVLFTLKTYYVEEDIFTQNFHIYKINEVITQTQKYLFFPRVNKQAVLREKKKVPRTLFKVRGVAGSAKYLQSKMSVIVFIRFINMFVYLVCLGMQISITEFFYLFFVVQVQSCSLSFLSRMYDKYLNKLVDLSGFEYCWKDL